MTKRLHEAFSTFEAARARYVEALRAELADLEAPLKRPIEQAIRVTTMPIDTRRTLKKPIVKPGKVIPKVAPKIRKAHGVPGQPGKLSDGSPTGGTHTACKKCGREVKNSTGPGSYKAFHFAPCGLPCDGANLHSPTVKQEDRKGGVHTGANCYGCSKKASA